MNNLENQFENICTELIDGFNGILEDIKYISKFLGLDEIK